MHVKPHVSVVIPVFDRLPVLEVVLRFFEYQTYPRGKFEVVVVDDGSPEQIGRALEAQSFDYPLKIVIQPNRGRAAARNAGVEHAEGDLILFCDADRIPDPGWVEAHASFHERAADSAAVGVPWDCFYAFARIKSGGREAIQAMRDFSREPRYFQTMRLLYSGETTRSPVSWAGFLVGNSSVRRTDVLAVGGFDQDLTSWGLEHFDFALRLTQARGTRICYLGNAANYHIPHQRERGYYRASIQKAVEVLAPKASGPGMALLRDFLFGEISLQELELRYGGHVSPAIDSMNAIYFTQLAVPPLG